MSFITQLQSYLEDPAAAKRVIAYVRGTGAEMYSGAWFDTYPMPPQAGSRVGGASDRIDSNDLIATTLLSIPVQLKSTSGFDPRTFVKIIEQTDRIAHLLRQLPTDVALHELDDADYTRLVGADDSPASSLWKLLRDEVAVPRVATFKLLARKRPALLPIRDGVLAKALGEPPDWWQAWRQGLRSHPDLTRRLAEVRKDADAPWLSLLRVADIVVWMAAQANSPAPAPE